MKDLAILHDQHLNRPTLDDSSEQEHAIEIATQEVTQVRVDVGPRPEAAFRLLPPRSTPACRAALELPCPAWRSLQAWLLLGFVLCRGRVSFRCF